MTALAVGPVAAIAAAFATFAIAASVAEEHGPQWLDEDSARTMRWVEERTGRTLAELRSDPRFQTLETEAAAILTQPGILEPVTFIGDDVYQYRQERERPLGLWRRTPRIAFLAGAPEWETVIDIQGFADAENAKFLFAGTSCFGRRCLVRLSRNGKDAAETREFDLDTKQFVEDGFRIAESKTSAWWYDADTLIVAPAFRRDEMTEALTPRTLKVWRRGEALDAARKVFEGRDRDAGVSAMLVRADGKDAFVAVRHVDFLHREFHLMTLDGASRPLLLPQPSNFVGAHDGNLLVRPNIDWTPPGGRIAVKAGGLVALPLTSIMEDASVADAEVIYTPEGGDALRGALSADGRLFVDLLHDYASRIVELIPAAGGAWTARTVPLSTGRFIELMGVAEGRLLLREEGPLSPDRIALVDPQSGESTTLYEEPAAFDAAGLVTEFNRVRSSDGELVTYAVTRRGDLAFDRCAPALVYGYGGFDVPLTPRYEPLFGKLWMERGGVYVHAYLRGGGEHGPDWRASAMLTNRQLPYDDMAAVLKDLHRRGVTAPRRTGIMGRSNGGLMVAAVMQQRPDLMNAAVVGGPLIDMLNYHELPPGSTWTAEFGDPRDAEARAFLRSYSPMQTIAGSDKRYPVPLIITSTDDDRVLPGHARRYSARLDERGHENLYFEDAQGGHYWELAGGPAPGDWRLRATARAVEFTYLWRQLEGEPQPGACVRN